MTLVGTDQIRRPRARVASAGGSHAVVADAYPLWRSAVESVLRELGVVTVGRAATPNAGIDLITEHHPDILVTDIDFGDGQLDGAEFVRRAREVEPGLRVVVLSGHRDRISDALAAGASAYAMKSVHPDDLAAAIRQTFEQSIVIAPLDVGVVPAVSAPVTARESAVNTPRSTYPLTKREAEILHLAAAGHANAAIARQLWVTEQTVKFHLSNIYRKLGVSNRTQASQWVLRREPEDPADPAD